jgi:hypothetical protein
VFLFTCQNDIEIPLFALAAGDGRAGHIDGRPVWSKDIRCAYRKHSHKYDKHGTYTCWQWHVWRDGPTLRTSNQSKQRECQHMRTHLFLLHVNPMFSCRGRCRDPEGHSAGIDVNTSLSLPLSLYLGRRYRAKRGHACSNCE